MIKYTAALAAILLVLTGCASGQASAPSTSATPTPTNISSEDEDLTGGVTTSEYEYETEASDWWVKLKVSDKQCFGSAGCVLNVYPRLGSIGDIPDEGIVKVTVKITGDESGTIIKTIEIDGENEDYSDDQVVMNTKSSKVTPKAKVIEAEYSA